MRYLVQVDAGAKSWKVEVLAADSEAVFRTIRPIYSWGKVFTILRAVK